MAERLDTRVVTSPWKTQCSGQSSEEPPSQRAPHSRNINTNLVKHNHSFFIQLSIEQNENIIKGAKLSLLFPRCYNCFFPFMRAIQNGLCCEQWIRLCKPLGIDWYCVTKSHLHRMKNVLIKYSIFYALCCLKYDTHNFCPFSLENNGNYFK